MTLLAIGLAMGVLATIVMDIWAIIAKHVLHLPTAHWNLVGRWFAYLARGTFVHRPISASPPIRNELALGWVAHYVTGVVYGIAYLFVVQVLMSRDPTLVSAVIFGLVTLVAPWCIMQPAMGAGFFARNTPTPNLMRAVNLSMHLVFGSSLYPAWRLVESAVY